MKKVALILLLAVLAGCGGGLNRSWNNFTAYYNTFYNAKNDFKAGLNKVEDQPVKIDPELPIRPHPAPVNAGSENFEEAIANSAQLLRRHSESKWTDDALLLIGKSYYYRQEYFLAIQTFEDLANVTSKSKLRQQTIIWKGRALLDIEAYEEGVAFLQEQLKGEQVEWEGERKAETQILLAQHHAMLAEWQQAAGLLEPAINNIDSRDFRGRSYFLLGQVLQQQGDFSRAIQAYSNVARNFPAYEYIYWADIKRAETARLRDDTELAVVIYRSMLNDDKNFDRSDEIYFRLAETLEEQGKTGRAEVLYKQVLRNKSATGSSQLLADTYYRLGQLYSDTYENYTVAAAYFDSASSLTSRQAARSGSGDAPGLASAFGDYVSLKNQIGAIDSLLVLGRMSPSERDAVLAEARRGRQGAQQTQREENTLVNINREAASVSDGGEAGGSSFGFLSYRNARRVEIGQQQFRAVWGARPLADNWRRSNAIRSTSAEERSVVPENPGTVTVPEGNEINRGLGNDLAGIPTDPQSRAALLVEKSELQYRLGNLFFLSLNQADSARSYFNRVLSDTTSSQIEAKSLYSLYKLHEAEQQPGSAARYRRLLLAEYPKSVFADRIRREEGGAGAGRQDSTALLREKVRELTAANDTLYTRAQRAEQLVQLALDNSGSPIAGDVYYRAIREYIQLAKDSSAVNDTLFYSGKAWDRVRSLIAEFRQQFPEAPQLQTVNAWAEEMKRSAEGRLSSCGELGIKPQVQPDMAAFLETVELPDRVKNLNLSGSLTYRLVIDESGAVESYGLISQPTGLGIEEAYAQAIEQSLRFEPVQQNGRPVRFSCEVELPIKQ